MTQTVLRLWVRWLYLQGMPSDHVAALLDADVETIVETIAAILAGQRDYPRPKLPPYLNVSPHRHDPTQRPILAQTGDKIRRLAALGYDAERIGEILMLDPRRVADFIARVTPIRKGRLVRPRDKAEQWHVRRNAERTEARKRERAEARAAREAWGSIVDPAVAAWRELVARPCRTTVPTVEREMDAAVSSPPAVEAPSVPSPWVGATKWTRRGEQHLDAKLTEAGVRDILRRHASGSSIYALAKEYKVNQGTIRAIVRGETWTHVERPPSPAPASSGPVD